MQGGVMPFLRSLAQGGTRAVLMSTPHPLTAQAWPSMTTGRSPSHTGITDFIRYYPAAGPGRFELTNGRDLRCESIWSLASRQGRRVTALNFYALWPPKPVSGYTLSSFVPWRHLKDAVYPPDLYTTISRLPNMKGRELATDWETERKCIEGMPPEDYEDWIALHIRRDRQWLDILRHLMTNDPSNLTAIVFDGVDKLQHLCWRFLDTELFPAQPTPWEAKIRRLCLEYFGELDSVIREAVQLAGPESRIFIASDHGSGPTTQIFYVNEWLHRQGYLAWTKESVPDATGRYSSNRLFENATQIDWSRTKAYAISASSNGIWLRGNGASPNGGVPGRDYKMMRAELARALLDYRNPATGQPVVTLVRMGEDVYPGLAAESAPDLLLTLFDGGFVSVLRSDQVVKPRPQPVGTHRPQGVFMAYGPGIREGNSHSALSILDVTPTLLYSLDLPVPDDLEGTVPEGVFQRWYFEANPPRRGGPTQPVLDVHDEIAPKNPERDAEIIERLTALGYL